MSLLVQCSLQRCNAFVFLVRLLILLLTLALVGPSALLISSLLSTMKTFTQSNTSRSPEWRSWKRILYLSRSDSSALSACTRKLSAMIVRLRRFTGTIKLAYEATCKMEARRRDWWREQQTGDIRPIAAGQGYGDVQRARKPCQVVGKITRQDGYVESACSLHIRGRVCLICLQQCIVTLLFISDYLQ